MCFDPTEVYFPVCFAISMIFLLVSSIKYVCIFVFRSLSNVILLSVYIVIFLSVLCVVSMHCSAVSIANCSAWLFVHFLFNRRCMLLIYCPDSKIAMPEPTLSSVLLPSVYICIDPLSSFSYVLLMLAPPGVASI